MYGIVARYIVSLSAAALALLQLLWTRRKLASTVQTWREHQYGGKEGQAAMWL